MSAFVFSNALAGRRSSPALRSALLLAQTSHGMVGGSLLSTAWAADALRATLSGGGAPHDARAVSALPGAVGSNRAPANLGSAIAGNSGRVCRFG